MRRHPPHRALLPVVELRAPAGWQADSRLPVVSAEEGLPFGAEDLWQASFGDGAWILDIGWDDARRRYDCRVIADGEWIAPIERAYLRSVGEVAEWARYWFEEVALREGSTRLSFRELNVMMRELDE